METEFKNLEGIVIKISKIPDSLVRERGAEIDLERDFFFSTIDDMIHKATVWTLHYYHDENDRIHPREQVYKVLATSNNREYPEIPLLDAAEFAKAINSMMTRA